MRQGVIAKGFSLIEVLMALMIFSGFATVLVSTQNTQVFQSTLREEDRLLHELAELKINHLLVNPPKLTSSLTLSPETGSFEEEGYPEIEYSITYARLKMPDLQNLQQVLQASQGGAALEDLAGSSSGANDIEKKIFELFTKNIEEHIWQVEVTVKKKDFDFPYILSTWMHNTEASINVNI